jgi:SAM-dependent methyltransferase
MSTFYRVAYAVGFHPWEDLAEHPPFATTLLDLVGRDESPDGQHGRALDVGCGSAIWGIELAKRGWDVTGVELNSRAVRRGRNRVAAAGLSMPIVRADVSKPLPAEVGTDHRLIVDTGTFHGLTDSQRQGMGRAISAVADDDATLILDCFAPGKRGPLPRGATEADIADAFPDWEIADVVTADTDPDTIAIKLKFDERFYRLRRR